jgi:hypothetical protein
MSINIHSGFRSMGNGSMSFPPVIQTKANLKVDCPKYFQDISRAWLQLTGCKTGLFNSNTGRWSYEFDCIVAMKRSGLMMGAFLSNKLNIPLFITSEIPSIPKKFKRVLLVDDKIWRGRSFRKYTRELKSYGKDVTTMCLYIEDDQFTDMYVEYVGTKVNLFYERHK